MRDIAPKALLVQVNTEKARIDYLTRVKNSRLLEIVQKDSKEATRRMIMDFKDNFDYCPVYYFYDTNASKIVAGDFTGALLDQDFMPARNIVLQPGDTNFLIGYYGIMVPDYIQPMTDEERRAIDLHNNMTPTDNIAKLYGKQSPEEYKHHTDIQTSVAGWRVLDHRFKNVRSPIPRTYYSLISSDTKKMKQRASKYKYVSKRVNIAYTASAFRYSATLERFYGPYPYNKQ